MPPKVVLALSSWVYHGSVTPRSWARLESFCRPVGQDREIPYSEDEFIEALQGAQGLMKWGELAPELTRRVFQHAPDLRLIGLWDDRFASGVDVEAAWEHGIKLVDVSNVASSEAVAEWVLGLTLLSLRNAGEIHRRMADGTETWANALNDEFVHGELTGRRVGLIGCGHVGQRLIQLLVPFRVELLVYDPFVSSEVDAELGIRRSDLGSVLRHAEILIVQVPHTPKTEKMIGARELGLLRRGAILINCCRGAVVDTEALLRKLEQREIVAGLDVFDPEPLSKGSRLRSLSNALITPHIAWYAPDSFPRYFELMVEEFERFFRGEAMRYELTHQMVAIRAGMASL
ncbi:MAG: hypothetical protein HYU36_12330 [Planctomycetes bacterium]|nr:hypothetical protein [Planctomycetota bacterium]